uniref:IF rod domain-containing protein n=1 Tax=Macrostomum lignano TaxID=282301 RepID=A0A1I8FFI3_9PLAT
LVTHAGIQTLVRFIRFFLIWRTTLGGAMASKTTTKTTRERRAARGPISAPKTVVINRTLPGFGMVGGDTVDSVKSVRARPTPKSNNMLNGREKEKKDMQELNERFANYIEKVRFLEAQNKKTAGKETERVKQTYETELAQLRNCWTIPRSRRPRPKPGRGQQAAQVDRETIDKLNQQLADYDGEISLLRRRVATFDEERSRDQKEIKRLRDEVNRLRGDLDAETLNHINAENEAQSLREQLEFMKQIHESELKELAALRLP